MKALMGAMVVILLAGHLNAAKDSSPVRTSSLTESEKGSLEKNSDAIDAQPLPPEPSISYTLPGIIGQGGTGWIGSDHLLNLTSDIYVTAEIIKPETLSLTFNEEDIRKVVLTEFSKKGFDINFTKEGSGPPLPYFDVLVMLQKIEGGFVTSIQGRLFEGVTLKRVILPNDITFQAITWEKENLIVMPTEQLKEQVLSSTKEIASLFLARYDFFERQKKKLKG